MNKTLPAPRPAAEAADRRRWLVLAVLGVAQLMVVLDATIMNVALPSAQRALEFSDTDRQWVVTAYALSFGSLLLIGGRLGDLLGRRTTFLVGLSGFAVASAVGGAAESFGMLVAARAGQGVFAALLAPATLSLLTTTFTDPKERAKAFAVFGALAGTGGAIGLLLGGALTTYVSWRWAMYVNIAFAAAAIAGAAALLPKVARAVLVQIDYAGTLLASSGLFALVYGLSHAETASWSDSLTIGFLASAVALLGAFVVSQTKVHNPLLPLRVVADRDRAGAFLAMLVVGSGMFAVFMFLTYYLQLNLGFSAIRTGVAFLPMVAGIIVTAQVTGLKLSRHFAPRVLVPLGMAISASAMVILSGITVEGGYASRVLPGLIVMGVGVGMVFATAMQSAVAGVEARDSGVASAMVNTMQQVGGSVGIALLGTIAGNAAAGYLTGKVAPTPELLAEAAVHSYTTTLWWAAAIFAGGAVLVAAVLKQSAPSLAASHGVSAEPVLAH
ncbi:MAG: MFS transporter [Sporichthyaceae bacterium]